MDSLKRITTGNIADLVNFSKVKFVGDKEVGRVVTDTGEALLFIDGVVVDRQTHSKNDFPSFCWHVDDYLSKKNCYLACVDHDSESVGRTVVYNFYGQLYVENK